MYAPLQIQRVFQLVGMSKFVHAEFNYLPARFYSRIKLFQIPPNITNIRVSEQFQQNEIVQVCSRINFVILMKRALRKLRPFDVVESFELNGEKFEVE